MSSINIAIIGAGPVGCTLARLLHLQCPSTNVTIFEGDISPDYRSQGGTLDLHTTTGLAALKEAGLMDEFEKHARYDGESLKMTDKDLRVYIQVNPRVSPDKTSGHLGGQRPEIDRSALRELLAESIPKGWIHWGWRLKEVLPADAPKETQLVFAVTGEDGAARTETVAGFDLIVGADGAWSKVRSGALSSTRPYFSGIAYHQLQLMDAEETAPEVYKAVNRGSLFAHSEGHKVTLQQMGDGSLSIGVNYRVEDERWVFDKSRCGFDATDLEDTKAAMLERLKDWHPLIREAIAKCSDRAVPRSLYMLPVGFSWTHRPGLTIIGDAAHVMTPYAGEGVNVGMEDAMRLAKACRAAGEDVGRLDREVAVFEAELVVRAGLYAKLTDDMLHTWFYTENSPKAALPRVSSLMARFHAPTLLKPLAGVLGAGFGYYRAYFEQ